MRTRRRQLTVAPAPELPARIEPRQSVMHLLPAVRGYFLRCYNVEDDGFRKYLRSTTNENAITKNRVFDRFRAVEQIRKMAEDAGDDFVFNAPEGVIYQCICTIMRQEGQGQKKRHYLTFHPVPTRAPAEEGAEAAD